MIHYITGFRCWNKMFKKPQLPNIMMKMVKCMEIVYEFLLRCILEHEFAMRGISFFFWVECINFQLRTQFCLEFMDKEYLKFYPHKNNNNGLFAISFSSLFFSHCRRLPSSSKILFWMECTLYTLDITKL